MKGGMWETGPWSGTWKLMTIIVCIPLSSLEARAEARSKCNCEAYMKGGQMFAGVNRQWTIFGRELKHGSAVRKLEQRSSAVQQNQRNFPRVKTTASESTHVVSLPWGRRAWGETYEAAWLGEEGEAWEKTRLISHAPLIASKPDWGLYAHLSFESRNWTALRYDWWCVKCAGGVWLLLPGDNGTLLFY